ncbi:MAG TPA: hypothetical protein VGD71_02895 [Kribbella sp.]
MTPTTNEQVSPPVPPGGDPHTAKAGLTEAARDQAGQLKDTAVDASQQVAGTTKEKAADVASDVRQQTRRLAGETRDQLAAQAGRQRDRAVDGLRSVGEELRGMAEHGQSGWGTQLARQGAEFSEQAADFLRDRGAGDLLDEVRKVARRRPGTFLLAAAIAGVTAGRLSRAMAAGSAGTSPAPATDELAAPADNYLVQPPTPTPAAPDPDPGAPVEPRFGPGTRR